MPIQVQTLTEQVVNSVVLAVMERRIPFGAHLKESELAKDLNVSRMPVREALRMLESEGVVVNQPYRGMCLMEVDDAKLAEILSVRLVLEREAFRLAVDRLDAGTGDLRGVEEALSVIESSWSQGSAAHMGESDIGFHRAVVTLAGNGTLRKLWEMMARQFQMIVGIAWHLTDQKQIYEQHVVLHQLLQAKDSAALQEVLGPHIMEAIDIGLGDLCPSSDNEMSNDG